MDLDYHSTWTSTDPQRCSIEASWTYKNRLKPGKTCSMEFHRPPKPSYLELHGPPWILFNVSFWELQWPARPEVHLQTVQPTERFPRDQNQDAKSRGTRDNAVRLRHVEPARVPLRHAPPSSPQVFDSLHRLARAQPCRPPVFLYRHAYLDGK